MRREGKRTRGSIQRSAPASRCRRRRSQGLILRMRPRSGFHPVYRVFFEKHEREKERCVRFVRLDFRLEIVRRSDTRRTCEAFIGQTHPDSIRLRSKRLETVSRGSSRTLLVEVSLKTRIDFTSREEERVCHRSLSFGTHPVYGLDDSTARPDVRRL